jgi:maltooligosyltrehalose trehalohydrolase
MLATPALPQLGAIWTVTATTFRLWATAPHHVELVIEGRDAPLPMQPSPDAPGLWTLEVPDVPEGARYGYLLNGEGPYPDPCSRFQPDGVHALSAVVAPDRYRWLDDGWPGLSRDGLVIYELHVGTFTSEGTFAAAIARLNALRDLGVTAIELMPVADFPGTRNWGYDGVALYAPARVYGTPDDLRRLVDAAHARGLGVILDVVYNHLGPDGNYLRLFSADYFTDRYCTPWGDALNYDGPGSRGTREYVLQNAAMWVREYHIDGLRLDATHAIFDASTPHILAEIAARARAAAEGRRIVVIAENETNDTRLIRPVADGGYGLDGVWADDFHHAVHTALTGEHEGYYADYDGSPEAIAAAVQGGFLYQGQPSPSTGRSRGTRVTDEPGSAFVFCLQNHDQIGNRAFGERLTALAPPDAVRAATALLLFAPETPLLFMGEEFAASSPFLYFTDHKLELGRLVTEGRRKEFRAFSQFGDPALRARIPDPQAIETFLRSKLKWQEWERNAGMLRLHRDLLALRRADPILWRSGRAETRAAACGPRAVAVLRAEVSAFRLLLCNLGEETPIAVTAPWAAELATAPLRVLLSTADPAYRQPEEAAGVHALAGAAIELRGLTLPTRTALLLAPAD